MAKFIKYTVQQLHELSEQNWETDENIFSRLSNITSCLVCLSAECYSAWNIRRKQIQIKMIPCQNNEQKRLLIESELHLLNLALSKNPKSTESWSYR